MNILISGGAKNGKSMFAQKTARTMAQEHDVPLYYVATMIPVDGEDEARIRRHRKERAGWGFETLERGRDLPGLLAGNAKATDAWPDDPETAPVEAAVTAAEGGAEPADPRGVFLLDSVTALLGNEMFLPDGSVDRNAPERVAEDCVRFAEMTGSTLFVSDYIYGGAETYECGAVKTEDPDDLTEAYRRGLALIDRRLAQVCDRVVEVSAGCVEDWKTPADSRPDNIEEYSSEDEQPER